MTIEEILVHGKRFRYQMLDRMRSDCEYYLDGGGRCNKFLWAGNPEDQIEYMKALYKSFPKGEKPRWLPWRQILEYEQKMLRET